MPIIPFSLSSLPADISAPALLTTVCAATATATAMLLICKSRFMRFSPYGKNLTRHHLEQPKRNPKRDPRGKMLFVSQIGTSKALATRLCDLLESKGVVLDLVDARNYEPESLPKENLVVLVASTSEVWNLYSARDFSSNHDLAWGARFFVDWIKEKANAFKVGAFVVNACSFSAFVVGSEVNEGGKNLRAKAANEIRGLRHTAVSNADFDSWWGSVVAVLQGAVLGAAADGICGESEPEDAGSSDPKRLYMLVENGDWILEETETGWSFSNTIKHRMLTINDDNFMKDGTIKLDEVGRVTPEWPLKDDLFVDNSRLPTSQGFCSVGHCLFFAGGFVATILPEWNLSVDDLFPSNLWCLKFKDSTWVWSICGSMFCHRSNPLIVPHDGKLYIFGGHEVGAHWVEIYSLKSGLWEKREVPNSALLPDLTCPPSSYFFWEDSNKSHKKTRIVLYSVDYKYNRQWLMSYDVKANSWEAVECNFPSVPEACSRKVVWLGCSHYLLIVDFGEMGWTWYIYDLSKKKLVAVVPIDDLDNSGMVSNIFCCPHTSKESLIYVLMEFDERAFEKGSNLPQLVPYARVRLQLKPFSAKIESKSYLRVDPHYQCYIFAAGVEGNKEKTVV
ncbi:hypothetical protein S83_057397 [Arachis hypogaea]